MHEILLPRTDTGVFLQAAVVFPALLGALVLVRRDRDLRIFVLGILVFTLALFGVRALH
ncbi:MAG: hypothetical protein WD271_16460 [Acidimicrobiia bacterium]